jgi:molybdopterin converting factor small subunit
MTINAMLLEIAKILAPFLAALLAYFLGLKAYHRQKQYELVRQRYLTDGVDKIAAEVQELLGVFSHNWRLSLSVLKKMRDFGASKALDMCDDLVNLDEKKLQTQAFYRLKHITGDDIFWQVYQLLVGFVAEANFFFKHDLCAGVRHMAAGEQPSIDPVLFFGEFYKRAKKLNEESVQFHRLTAALEEISRKLERETFTLRKLSNLVKDQEIKGLAAALRDTFGEELGAIEARATSSNKSSHSPS